jgi:hypothetical protein
MPLLAYPWVTWANPVIPGRRIKRVKKPGDAYAGPAVQGNHLRARPDETHVTALHIEDLWQLVQMRVAQEASEECDALLICEHFSAAFPLLGKRAKLPQDEDIPGQTHAFLGEENLVEIAQANFAQDGNRADDGQGRKGAEQEQRVIQDLGLGDGVQADGALCVGSTRDRGRALAMQLRIG